MDLKVKIVTEAELTALQGAQKRFKTAAESAGVLREALKGVEEQSRQTNASLTAAADRPGKSAKDSASAIMGAKGAQDARDTAGALAQMTTEAKGLAPALDETGKAAERATVSKKTLKDAIKQLSRAVPELGSLALALKNPWVLIAAAIAGVVVAFKKFIDKVNEMEVAIEAFSNLNKAATPIKQIMQDGARATKAQADELHRIATESDDAETALGKVVKQMEAKAAQEKEIRAAQRELDEAGISADEQTGAITPAEAVSRRSALATRYGALDQAAAGRLGAQRVEAIEQARLAAVMVGDEARLALPAAEAKREQTKIDVAERKGSRKSDRAKLDIDEASARKIINDGKPFSAAFFKAMFTGVDGRKFRADADQQEVEQRGVIEDIKVKRTELDAADDADDAKVTSAGKTVSDLEGKQRTALKQSGDFLERRGETAREVGAETATAAEVGRLQAATRQIEEKAALIKEATKAQEERDKRELAALKGLFDQSARGQDAIIREIESRRPN